MPAIKSLDRIVAKWKRVAAAAGEEYRVGIENPKADWMAQTKAAESRYEAGVTGAISRKGFGKGVSRAGTAKWQAMSIAKGPGRWSEGIGLAGDAYSTGFAPYAAVIARTSLPPRGPKGSAQNIQRVAVIAKALYDEKLKRMGGGT